MNVYIIVWLGVPLFLAIVLGIAGVRFIWLVVAGLLLWSMYWTLVSGTEGAEAYGLIVGGGAFASWTVGALFGRTVRKCVDRTAG